MQKGVLTLIKYKVNIIQNKYKNKKRKKRKLLILFNLQ